MESNFEILVMLIFKKMIPHSNLLSNNEKNIDTIHLKYYLISNIYEIILYSFSNSFNIYNFIYFFNIYGSHKVILFPLFYSHFSFFLFFKKKMKMPNCCFLSFFFFEKENEKKVSKLNFFIKIILGL